MNDWSGCILYHQCYEWSINGCVQLSPMIWMIGQLDMYNIADDMLHFVFQNGHMWVEVFFGFPCTTFKWMNIWDI